MTKKLNVKRRFRRSGKQFTDNVNVPRNVIKYSHNSIGFPDRMVSKVRYHESGNMTSLLGALATYGYRVNSTFDPDFTSGGHQPLYRDTYASIYDHYSVLSTTGRVTFVNISGNSFIAGVVIDDDTTPQTSLDAIAEQGHSSYDVLGPLTSSRSVKTFNFKWDCKSFLGIDPYTSETYKTAVGSNPAEEQLAWLFAADLTSGVSTTITFDVVLEQTVLWTELTTPSQS